MKEENILSAYKLVIMRCNFEGLDWARMRMRVRVAGQRADLSCQAINWVRAT